MKVLGIRAVFMRVNFFIFIALALAAPLVAIKREHLCLLAITAVNNASRERIRIIENSKVETIEKLSKKNLRKQFLIPFVSIACYKEQFLRDEPYIPQEALFVKTLQGVFALWEDETGIMVSRKCRDSEGWRREECLSRKLFHSINYDDQYTTYDQMPLRMQAFLLWVNAQGKLDLQELLQSPAD